MNKFAPKFDPALHQVVEVFGFMPGDVLTFKITAKSIGTVFICKAINEDPIIEVNKSND